MIEIDLIIENRSERNVQQRLRAHLLNWKIEAFISVRLERRPNKQVALSKRLSAWLEGAGEKHNREWFCVHEQRAHIIWGHAIQSAQLGERFVEYFHAFRGKGEALCIASKHIALLICRVARTQCHSRDM